MIKAIDVTELSNSTIDKMVEDKTILLALPWHWAQRKRIFNLEEKMKLQNSKGENVLTMGAFGDIYDQEAGEEPTKEAAEYIVRACNMHYELIEALEYLTNKVYIGMQVPYGKYEKINNLLQKAKGE